MHQTYIANTNFEKQTRIHCYVGYHCNIECDFCTNRKYEAKPTPEMVDRIIDNIKQLKIDVRDTVIHLSGGELYQDEFDIAMYEPLLMLYSDVPKSTITNLMYYNIGRCINLWKKYDVELWTSYDSRGRFKTSQMLNLWLSNLKKVVRCGINPIINIISTPFSYEDPFVKILCENYRVFFSPLENKNGNIVLTKLNEQMINTYQCLNSPKPKSYKCKVITLNDTYVDQFCAINVLK